MKSRPAPLLYIETDGKVFLVGRGGRLGLPAASEVPFGLKRNWTWTSVGGSRVVFCKPRLDRHPADWPDKDSLPGRDDVEPLAREAAALSYTRCTAKVAIVRGGKVLMVKGTRGFTKGIWNLPGGFISYGEAPVECARREAEEEVGVKIRVVRLLGVYSRKFNPSGLHFISFVYEGRITGGEPRPDPDEIGECGWFSLEEAKRISKNPFATVGLERLSRT